VRHGGSRFLVGSVAVVVVCLGLALPAAAARPRVSATFLHRPAVQAAAVDALGRAYTISNGTSATDRAAILRAYSFDGSLRWERAWRIPHADVFALDVGVAPAGAIAVAGRVLSTDPARPCDEIWGNGWAVRTWSPSGAVSWQRTEPGWRKCEVGATSGTAVAIGADSVALGIQYADEYFASVDLMSLDRDGSRRWVRHVRASDSQNERVGDLAVGFGGAVYLAGTLNAVTLDSGEHDADAVLAKFHSNGSLAWMRRVPDGPPSSADDFDAGTSAAVGGHRVLFGALLDEPRDPKARIAAYGLGGALKWQRNEPTVRTRSRRWPGPWVGFWRGGALLAGTEFVAGSRSSRPVVRGFSLGGAGLWRVRLGRDDAFWGGQAFASSGDLIVTAGGGYLSDREDRVWILTS
jgi:hypothetical protein